LIASKISSHHRTIPPAPCGRFEEQTKYRLGGCSGFQERFQVVYRLYSFKPPCGSVHLPYRSLSAQLFLVATIMEAADKAQKWLMKPWDPKQLVSKTKR